ncbi:hypothetical protein SBDP2_330012 [Syntrophobacter sp. SbD2]|nr:hypothetical protein SBDP2_330012 [Syntrophobacter sp. SbD2]
MPTEVTARYESARTSLDTPVRPTLFIGLGGSGKEVLMRLRRLFYTNIRRSGLPICQYLWIDTDPSNQNIEGQDYDEISPELDLPEDDVVRAGIEEDTLHNYYNCPGNYGHINEWLHKSIKQHGPKDLSSGAGGIRACGRLAFWHHYSTIKQRITDKLKAIADPVARKDTENLDFTVDKKANKNVFLAASVAGGTGAGMFLDTAFLLRSIPRENLFSTGIFFLPSIFESVLKDKDEQRVDACYTNGYAALMELDYFNSPITGLQLLDKKDVYEPFNFKWDGHDHFVHNAPIDTIYLLGWKNASGVQLHQYTEAFQMAAEAIHLEFCQSSFGTKKRSIRVNLQDYLINETHYTHKDMDGNIIYTQYFPNRYSSFGLSLLKLDVDRRKNAAAYYFANSLTQYWRSSNSDTAGVNGIVSAALTVPHRPDLKLVTSGSSWSKDTLWREFLIGRNGSPENASMLETHRERIKREFQTIRQGINAKFNRKKEMEIEEEELRKRIAEQPDVKIWEALPLRGAEVQPIAVQLKSMLSTCQQEIASGKDDLAGRHKEEITANASRCLTLMQESFQKHFYSLIANPGSGGASSGVMHATDFCVKYLARIAVIRSEFIVRTIGSDTCELKLNPITVGKDLTTLRGRRDEARAIKAPLFSGSAVALFNMTHSAAMEKHLDKIKQEFLNTVNDQERKLIEWFEGKYWNQVCASAEEILKNLVELVKKFSDQLGSYVVGLSELGDVQNKRFASFSSVQDDIRHYSIELGKEEDWYKEKIIEALNRFHLNAAAMPWEMFLEGETDAFFKDWKQNPSMITIEGFKDLFRVTHERQGEPLNWKSMEKSLEEYCFNRLKSFLENTDADKEFQKSSAKDKGRELDRIVGAADVWVSSNNTICKPLEETYIGIPSAAHCTTAKDVAKSTLFKGAALISHEKGNIPFYKESVAFPLFHVEELAQCREKYENAIADPTRLYHRHLDYKLIYKLREIDPPATEQEAKGLFEAGVLLLQAIMLGCCAVDATPEREMLRVRLPRSADSEWAEIGPSFAIAAKVLNGDKKLRPRLQSQIDLRLHTLRGAGREAHIEMLCLADYYTNNVFPKLQRAGHHGIANFYSNASLISKELRTRLKTVAVSIGGFTDENDPALWDAVDKYNFEEISSVFPFTISDAQAPLRCLKI